MSEENRKIAEKIVFDQLPAHGMGVVNTDRMISEIAAALDAKDEQVKAQEQQFRLSVAKLVEAAREANEKFKIWNGGTGMERITEALKPFPKEPTEKERSGEVTTDGR